MEWTNNFKNIFYLSEFSFTWNFYSESGYFPLNELCIRMSKESAKLILIRNETKII